MATTETNTGPGRGQLFLPEWVVPLPRSVRDLSCLALRMLVEQEGRPNGRLAAGMVAVLSWVRGLSTGPMTGRTDPASSRNVALAELCAAECRVDDEHPVPPLAEVCALLEVGFCPVFDVDPGYARGVWLALRWCLGETPRPPLDLPIRHPDGALLDQTELYAGFLARQYPADPARRAELARYAATLASDSRRLADLVEDTATIIRTGP